MATMDLSLLFGNLRNHEETKILCMEITRDTHRDRYVALYSKKFAPNNDNDLSNESKGEALIVKNYISQMKKNHLV